MRWRDPVSLYMLVNALISKNLANWFGNHQQQRYGFLSLKLKMRLLIEVQDRR